MVSVEAILYFIFAQHTVLCFGKYYCMNELKGPIIAWWKTTAYISSSKLKVLLPVIVTVICQWPLQVLVIIKIFLFKVCLVVYVPQLNTLKHRLGKSTRSLSANDTIRQNKWSPKHQKFSFQMRVYFSLAAFSPQQAMECLVSETLWPLSFALSSFVGWQTMMPLMPVVSAEFMSIGGGNESLCWTLHQSCWRRY